MSEDRRERAVPCRAATLQESIRGLHKTWNLNAICDRCQPLADQAVLAARARFAPSGDAGASSVPTTGVGQ